MVEASISIVIIRILWDIFYRIFFIYPHTSFNGWYAHSIEETDLARWVFPVLASKDKEVLFVGNSHVIDGIDPVIVERRTGFKCFNFAFYFVSFINSLETLVRYRYFPKLAIIDVSTRYSIYQEKTYIEQSLLNFKHLSSFKRKMLEIFDHIQFIFPSFFVPARYSPIYIRSLRRLFALRKEGKIAPARYTPFRRFISYKWAFRKATNHRNLIRYGAKTESEIAIQDRYLQLCIEQTTKICNNNTSEYRNSLAKLEEVCSVLRKNDTKLVFLRLPLDERMINHENENCPWFFADVKKIASKYKADYLDLNSKGVASQLGKLEFYTDGLHLERGSAEKVSEFLGEYINKNYKSINKAENDQFIFHASQGL